MKNIQLILLSIILCTFSAKASFDEKPLQYNDPEALLISSYTPQIIELAMSYTGLNDRFKKKFRLKHLYFSNVIEPMPGSVEPDAIKFNHVDAVVAILQPIQKHLESITIFCVSSTNYQGLLNYLRDRKPSHLNVMLFPDYTQKMLEDLYDLALPKLTIDFKPLFQATYVDWENIEKKNISWSFLRQSVKDGCVISLDVRNAHLTEDSTQELYELMKEKFYMNPSLLPQI